jgi:LysM repeat protein
MHIVTHLRRALSISMSLAVVVSTAAVLQAPGASPAQAACSINTTLRVGARGAQVSCLESTLRAKGLQSSYVDDYFGTVTRSTIIRFQRANRLYVDGVVGPQTARALGIWGSGTAAPTPTPPPAPTPPRAPAPTPPPASGGTYTVVRGDYLYGIARKTGTNINTLLSLNNLRLTSTIYPGQRLRTGAGTPAPAPLPAPTPPATPAPTGSCSSVRMVGDSMGVSIASTISSELAARNIPFHSKNVSATGTPAMTAFVGQVRSAHGDAPCWVVVSGSNDMYFTARSTTAGPERVAQMINAINANGVRHRIFWVNTLSWNSTTGMARINAAIAASGVEVVDWHAAALPNRWWFTDHVHTGATGNRARANLVVAAVTR